MEPRPSPAASDYWYPALADGRIDVVLRDASKRAWPYAVYCATRYHRDIHVAHELMDDALLRTERYLASSGDSQPTPSRVWYYIIGVLKRLSKQRLRHPEVSSGSLSDLDLIVQHLARGTPQEESAYVNQLVSRMTPPYKADLLLETGRPQLSPHRQRTESRPRYNFPSLQQRTP
jgi:hypothetical protein